MNKIKVATLTYRTTEEKRSKLQKLAKRADTSVNKMIDDWATHTIAESETFYQFQVMAEHGK
jgi:hypothetical protein